jgi:hypothetical protein
MLLIDYDKTYYSTTRHTLYDILKSRNIPGTLLSASADICTQDLIKLTSKLSRLAEINKAVRQVCPPSPTPCNMYLDERMTK